MIYSETVGIDISKKSLDATIYLANQHGKFSNDLNGFKQLIKWVSKHCDDPLKQILFCCEHTGLYALEWSVFCHNKGIALVMESGLRIKKSLGLQRGKNDKIDSRFIAEYAFEKKHKLSLYTLPSPKLQQLKHLLALRKKLVRDCAGYKTSLKEYKRVLIKKENQVLISCQEKMIHYINKQLDQVDKEILQIINADKELRTQYNHLISIKGVGFVMAVNMIVYTAAFSKFNNWRQFACYIGTAPFAQQSGSSVRSKARVHSYGYRRIKGIVHMGACSAIVHNAELRQYYQQRIAKGKNKMSTLNIIRNKLLARMFATVKRGSPYVQTHNFAA